MWVQVVTDAFMQTDMMYLTLLLQMEEKREEMAEFAQTLGFLVPDRVGK